MSNLYYNFGEDYFKMIVFLKKLFDVNSSVLPVTVDSAYIKAILKN
jgi:hypothetical protein